METQESIDTRASRVQEALQSAFGVKGKTLAVALRRTGRRMPKRLHVEALRIVEAQGLGGHPKLMRQVDGVALAAAEQKVIAYLSEVDRADRRKGFWIGIGAAVAFNLLLIATALVLWMIWSGQV